MPSDVLALAAAALFAVANLIQRGAAAGVPLESGGPVRLVLRLVRTPRWLAGSLLAVVALGLHALALAHGSVIVVQSLLAAGLVIALTLEAAQERRLMRVAEAGGSVVLVTGVVLVLAVGQPGGGDEVGLAEQLITAAALAGLAGTAFLGFRLHHRMRLSALIMGATAGACFALDAVFLKGLADTATELDTVAVAVDVAGFAAASVLGNLVVQRAYQLAPLRFVLPSVTAGDPLAAFVVGKLILHEHLQGGAWASLAVTAGLAAMAAGIVITTTAGAPVVPRSAETESEPAGPTAGRIVTSVPEPVHPDGHAG